MSVDGTPKFGTISVKEITIEVSATNVALTGKAAFVNRETNATHGWTKGEGAIWSPETLALVHQLQEAMEHDLARLHFYGDTLDQPQARRSASVPNFGGLAEHLEEADQT